MSATSPWWSKVRTKRFESRVTDKERRAESHSRPAGGPRRRHGRRLADPRRWGVESELTARSPTGGGIRPKLPRSRVQVQHVDRKGCVVTNDVLALTGATTPRSLPRSACRSASVTARERRLWRTVRDQPHALRAHRRTRRRGPPPPRVRCEALTPASSGAAPSRSPASCACALYGRSLSCASRTQGSSAGTGRAAPSRRRWAAAKGRRGRRPRWSRGRRRSTCAPRGAATTQRSARVVVDLSTRRPPAVVQRDHGIVVVHEPQNPRRCSNQSEQWSRGVTSDPSVPDISRILVNSPSLAARLLDLTDQLGRAPRNPSRTPRARAGCCPGSLNTIRGPPFSSCTPEVRDTKSVEVLRPRFERSPIGDTQREVVEPDGTLIEPLRAGVIERDQPDGEEARVENRPRP